MNKTPLQQAAGLIRTIMIQADGDSAVSYNEGLQDALEIVEALYLEERRFARDMWSGKTAVDASGMSYRLTSFEQIISTYEK